PSTGAGRVRVPKDGRLSPLLRQRGTDRAEATVSRQSAFELSDAEMKDASGRRRAGDPPIILGGVRTVDGLSRHQRAPRPLARLGPGAHGQGEIPALRAARAVGADVHHADSTL